MKSLIFALITLNSLFAFAQTAPAPSQVSRYSNGHLRIRRGWVSNDANSTHKFNSDAACDLNTKIPFYDSGSTWELPSSQTLVGECKTTTGQGQAVTVQIYAFSAHISNGHLVMSAALYLDNDPLKTGSGFGLVELGGTEPTSINLTVAGSSRPSLTNTSFTAEVEITN